MDQDSFCELRGASLGDSFCLKRIFLPSKDTK